MPNEPRVTDASSDRIVMLSREGDVARVELNRPPHNLLDAAMLDALDAAFEGAVDGGSRAILLTSRLRHFSAGADLEAMRSGMLEKLDLLGFLHRMEALGIPTVAAIHGAALGGGFELALGCDLIVATETAQLGLVETTLGLFPLMGGVQRLVAVAGPARAKEIALLGRRHTAATFERWGVINQVVADEALLDTGRSLALQLAAGPTVAYRAVRRIANRTVAEGVAAGDAITDEIAPSVWESHDLEAGLRAYLETGSAGARFTGT